MSIISNESIQGSFYGLSRQAESISEKFDIILKNLMKHEDAILVLFNAKKDLELQIKNK